MTVPAAVRGAGVIVAVQGTAALGVAVALVVRGFDGADQRVVNGFGTAVWFALAGTGVLTAGCGLLVGKRWGRGPAVFTQLLLLPVTWHLAVGSYRLGFAIPMGIIIMALTVLASLFSPPATRWVARDGQRGSAGFANRRQRADS
ncbi:hypothetical protein MSM1_12270 [Mycobacterium sp. SM1]|uniref:hypothetical protein n=1 Tax=Mycobacterium sp. SM1 TaxID=2816243 RepID=UPI001BCDD265|nr:hypothetical protein [Mycobacterium sp. SM1]MBS4729078.1 hypothetical protein [Mycobacterium sp. SM1]